MERPTTIVFARHGETVWNVEDKIQGHSNSDLTKLGIEQAYQLDEELAHFPFVAIYSSDLERAHKTAQILAQRRNIPLIWRKELRERNFGPYEGTTKDNLKLLDLESDEVDFEKLGVESNKSITERLLKLIKEVSNKHDGEHVLFVGHGGAMRILLLSLGFAKREELPPSAVGNIAYFALKCEGDKYQVTETKRIADSDEH